MAGTISWEKSLLGQNSFGLECLQQWHYLALNAKCDEALTISWKNLCWTGTVLSRNGYDNDIILLLNAKCDEATLFVFGASIEVYEPLVHIMLTTCPISISF